MQLYLSYHRKHKIQKILITNQSLLILITSRVIDQYNAVVTRIDTIRVKLIGENFGLLRGLRYKKRENKR